MRLLINCLSSVSGGAVNYLKNILPLLPRAVLAENAATEISVLYHEFQQDLIPADPSLSRIMISGRRYGGILRVMWEANHLPEIIADGRFDIAFTPYQIAIQPSGCRHVLMLRNMDPFRFREYRRNLRGLARNVLLEHASVRCLSHADRVVAVSKHAYNYAQSVLCIDESRLLTIYHGRNPTFDANPRLGGRPVKTAPGYQFPYVLSVGSLFPYRRVEDVIDAFAKSIAPNFSEYRLVIAGDSDDDSYKRLIRRLVADSLCRDRILLLGHVATETLAALYKGADCYVTATEVEACPNTAIEALGASCPIVASRAEPLPEILGEAALYYEARRTSEFGSQLARVLRDKTLREQLSFQAWKRAQSFDWETCAASTARALVAW